jgi:hypothetical protein
MCGDIPDLAVKEVAFRIDDETGVGRLPDEVLESHFGQFGRDGGNLRQLAPDHFDRQFVGVFKALNRGGSKLGSKPLITGGQVGMQVG